MPALCGLHPVFPWSLFSWMLLRFADGKSSLIVFGLVIVRVVCNNCRLKSVSARCQEHLPQNPSRFERANLTKLDSLAGTSVRPGRVCPRSCLSFRSARDHIVVPSSTHNCVISRLFPCLQWRAPLKICACGDVCGSWGCWFINMDDWFSWEVRSMEHVGGTELPKREIFRCLLETLR